MSSQPDGPAESAEYRFYGELATWWPLVSPPGDYLEEAAFVEGVLESLPAPVTQILELGSGGGHNAVHLKARYEMSLVDLSEDMLEVSRRLNPESAHYVGDMRTVRLGRTFDAVFVHDAVDYMTTEDDLLAAMTTAFVHLRAGGTALFLPDDTIETFEDSTDHGGQDSAGGDGRGVRYLEWNWDPDPADTWTLTEYAFLLRDTDGSVRVVNETHRLGIFGRDVWLRLLAEAGFQPETVTEQTTEDRTPRTLFIGRRPPD